MKRAICAATIASVLLTANLWAETNSNLNIIGFSEGGKYLAFEVNGYEASTGGAFSLIQIVDVEKNDFIAGDPATWCAVDSPPTEIEPEVRSFTGEPSCTTSPTPSIPGRSTTRRISLPTIEQLHFFSVPIEKPPAFGLNFL